jgi:hypothetical protein
MGQYHTIYNLDKKESYSAGGAKLWEKAYFTEGMMGLMVLLSNSNGRGGGDFYNPISPPLEKGEKYTMHINGKGRINVTKKDYLKLEKLLKEINGRWAGDRIVIQGDYAEKDDPSFIPEDVEFKDISRLVFENMRDILAFKSELIDCEHDDTPDVIKSIESELQYCR